MHGALARDLFDSAAAETSVHVGSLIGAFKVIEQIGRGGMGAVYRASRISGGFEQTVAIKLMLAANASMRDRFQAEIEILASLSHPNIAQLIDGGRTNDGSLYLAMEYVDGIPLSDYCQVHDLGTRERIVLLLKIADALSHAHRSLVIHRDIKPNNILVGRKDGRPKLVDFGIAKVFGALHERNLTVQSIGPMTPTYAAPEQFKGEAITVATDVYQFGVLTYQLISGGLPYSAKRDDPVAWATAVLEDDPISLGRATVRHGAAHTARRSGSRLAKIRRGNRDLDAILRMALAKEPNQRYGSMDALIADLEAYLDGRPVSARHGGAWYRITRFATKYRWLVLVSSLAIAGLALTSFIAVSQALHARSEATRLRASVDLLNGVLKAADISTGGGRKRTLEDLLDVAAKDVVLRLASHPDLRAGVLLQVADAYASMGLPARAAPLYEQAIGDFRRQSKSGLDFAQALASGALATYWSGNFEQAQQWNDEAFGLAQGDDNDSAKVRDGLYFTRWQLLRSKAESAACYEVAQQSVENAERAQGATRDALLQLSFVRRGTSLTDLRRFDEAEDDLLAAVEIARRLYGSDHGSTMKAEQALGWHYVSRGDPHKGLEILEPLGERVRELFGENSQEFARNLFNRGNAYAVLEDRWESGLSAFQQSARIYRDASSPRISVAALFNAASLLFERQRCEQAAPVYAELEAIWAQSPDLRDPHFRVIYTAMGSCALEANDFESAKKNFQAGLALYRATDETLGDYADLLVVGSRIAEAEADISQARALLDQAIGIVSDDSERAGDLELWRQHLNALSPTDSQSDTSPQ